MVIGCSGVLSLENSSDSPIHTRKLNHFNIVRIHYRWISINSLTRNTDKSKHDFAFLLLNCLCQYLSCLLNRFDCILRLTCLRDSLKHLNAKSTVVPRNSNRYYFKQHILFSSKHTHCLVMKHKTSTSFIRHGGLATVVDLKTNTVPH